MEQSKGRRILLAFETVEMIDELTSPLRRARYQVESVRDGLETVEKVKAEAPDMLILDVELPSLDGFQVVKRLKVDPNTREIPIIFIQTRGPSEDAITFRYFQSGADCLLNAPVRPMELLTFVKRILDSLGPRPIETPQVLEGPFL